MHVLGSGLHGPHSHFVALFLGLGLFDSSAKTALNSGNHTEKPFHLNDDNGLCSIKWRPSAGREMSSDVGLLISV